MLKYQYKIKLNDGSATITYTGHAINIQQMLAKIENEKNLDMARIIEIKEIQR